MGSSQKLAESFICSWVVPFGHETLLCTKWGPYKSLLESSLSPGLWLLVTLMGTSLAPCTAVDGGVGDGRWVCSCAVVLGGGVVVLVPVGGALLAGGCRVHE